MGTCRAHGIVPVFQLTIVIDLPRVGRSGPRQLVPNPEVDYHLPDLELLRSGKAATGNTSAMESMTEALERMLEQFKVDARVVAVRQWSPFHEQRDPGHRHRQVGGAVVAVLPGDDHLLVGHAQLVEVEVDQPNRGVVGHRPARPVDHVVERPGRQAGQLGGELGDGNRRVVAERRVVGHLRGLLGHGPTDFGPPVAGVHAPQPTDAVQVAATVAVEDVGALRLGHHEGPLLVEGLEVGPRVDEVVDVLLTNVLRVVLVELARDLRLNPDFVLDGQRHPPWSSGRDRGTDQRPHRNGPDGPAGSASDAVSEPNEIKLRDGHPPVQATVAPH